MPRVTFVKKAQKKQGQCGKCDKEIKAGDPYRWWKFRYGGRRIRCMECPGPRQSELTNSDKLSRCYAAGESIEDAISRLAKDGDADDLRSACEDAANELREVAEEYRESASNIESGFNGNRVPMCDELEEKADNLDSLADEVESAKDQIEDFDEDRVREEAEADMDEIDAKATDEIKKEREEQIQKVVDEKREEWAEEQAAHVEEYTSLSPE